MKEALEQKARELDARVAALANRVDELLAASRVWFAVGHIGEHCGFVESRIEADAWDGSHPHGWTVQDVTGPHGTILFEGGEAGARRALADFLADCPANHGGRCYTHAP